MDRVVGLLDVFSRVVSTLGRNQAENKLDAQEPGIFLRYTTEFRIFNISLSDTSVAASATVYSLSAVMYSKHHTNLGVKKDRKTHSIVFSPLWPIFSRCVHL